MYDQSNSTHYQARQWHRASDKTVSTKPAENVLIASLLAILQCCTLRQLLAHFTAFHYRFGATAKPVDNVHAPDFSTNRCASFLHPYIEYHSFGEYIDQMELQEALIVRFDAWTSSKFPQWPLSANENYIKHYINEKVWSISTCKLFQYNHNRSCLILIYDMITPHSPKSLRVLLANYM